MNGRFWALLAGLVFGAGLGLSGMTKPSKVIGFLDVTGRWDASLAFVVVLAGRSRWASMPTTIAPTKTSGANCFEPRPTMTGPGQ